MVETDSKPITPEAVYDIYLSLIKESAADFEKARDIAGSVIKSSVEAFALFTIDEEPYFPQQIVVGELPILSNPDMLYTVIYEPRTNTLGFGERPVKKYQGTGDGSVFNISLMQKEEVTIERPVRIANNNDWLEHGEAVLQAVKTTLDSLKKAKKPQAVPT